MRPTDPRFTGIGLGLRAPLAEAIVHRAPPSLRWLEVSPENHMNRGGSFVRMLHEARAKVPLLTHGLTMCPGSTDPLDRAYLADLAAFVRAVEAPWHSDHLCFGHRDGVFLHDLLPIPFTREAAAHTAARVREAMEALPVPFALENLSWYAHPGEAELDEAAFIRAVLDASGAWLMLDVNNVYVNARNHGFDARAFLDALPLDRVVQMHVAGHLVAEHGFRIDTHGEPICDDVYDLLHYALRRTGPVPVLLERDHNPPPWEALVDELDRLDAIWRDATGVTP